MGEEKGGVTPQDLVEVELPVGRGMQPANARAQQSGEGMAEGVVGEGRNKYPHLIPSTPLSARCTSLSQGCP